MLCRPLLAVLALACAAQTVHAEEPSSDGESNAPSAERDISEAEFEEADSKTGKSALRFSGRVFTGVSTTRQTLVGTTHWRSKQSVGSARLGLRYTHKSGARAVIKVEFEDDEPELKDGYIRLSPHDSVRVQAGRFKRPLSAIGLASRWDLPSIERGLLNSLSVEGQDLPFVGGRGVGLTTRYAPNLGVGLNATLGVFQNGLGTGSSSLDSSENFAQDLYLRVALSPVPQLDIASSMALFGYLKQTGDPDSFAHAPVGSLDVSYAPKWLRLWAEAYAGTSMLAQGDGSTGGNFVGARALVSANLRTGTPRRLQPYLGASYFDPQLDGDSDANTELQGGVNFAFTKIWRLQVEAAHTFAQELASATASTVFRVQLGARFKD